MAKKLTEKQEEEIKNLFDDAFAHNEAKNFDDAFLSFLKITEIDSSDSTAWAGCGYAKLQ